MPIYTQEQLMLVDIETLQSIATELGTPNKNCTEKEILVQDIITVQNALALVQQSATPPKRKRGRPSKAEIAAREQAALTSEESLESLLTLPTNTNQEEEPTSDSSSLQLQAQDSFETLNELVVDDNEADTISQESFADNTEEVISKLSTQETPNVLIDKNIQEFMGKPVKYVSNDFLIIQDIPDFTSHDNIVQTQTASTKFRKFKDDPLVNNQPSNDKVENKKSKKDSSNAILNNTVLLDGSGVLELTKEGYGFLRSADYNYLTSPDDIYVSPAQLRQYGLKPGDIVEGKVKIPREDDKFFVLHSVTLINGMLPEMVRNRVAFEHLTPLFPDEKFNLCNGKNDSYSRRVVDLFAPIGKGQRALIVAQPKTGKTMLMKDIANAIAENHPETYLMMLLIDERPEEVTDMQRTVKAEVIASTFDAPASNHVKIAGIVLEKAKRMVECGHDVVIFLDSITRLARAYNTEAPASGKILSGGVDANSLQRPKRFFGAARNIEGGGSLTIIATALIDTGSRMDEVIFEEFKGTGNMELQLDRTLANKRIYPAVNVIASSTRRDDLLLPQSTSNRMWVFRNYLSDMNCVEAMQAVLKQMSNTQNNEELLVTMSKP